jgi:hypothetical protein
MSRAYVAHLVSDLVEMPEEAVLVVGNGAHKGDDQATAAADLRFGSTPILQGHVSKWIQGNPPIAMTHNGYLAERFWRC